MLPASAAAPWEYVDCPKSRVLPQIVRVGGGFLCCLGSL